MQTELETPSQIEESKRRLETLAREALEIQGISGRLTLLSHSINTTFRFDQRAAEGNGDGEEGRRVLRLYRHGTYDEARVRSEVAWLESLVQAGVPVPAPVTLPSGSPLFQVVDNGHSRLGVLFHWLDGRFPTGDPTLEQVTKVGELLGRLHRHSTQFQQPQDFNRPHFDLDGLLGREHVLPPEAGGDFISRGERQVLEEAALALRRELETLGQEADVFGLIHGDLTPKNWLFHQGEARALDFADFGWGYFPYDVATSLLRLSDLEGYPQLRKAFLDAYRSVRPFPEAHEKSLEAFLACRHIFLLRWLCGFLHLEEVHQRARDGFPFLISQVRRYLDTRRTPRRRGERPPAHMSTVELLAHLHERDIHLRAEGDRLKFNAPKGALTPPLKDELKKRKAELLRFLQETVTAANRSAPPLTPAKDRQDLPLSYAQERMWFFNRYQPESPAYNMSSLFHLGGPLDPKALLASLREVVCRHEVLRTTFADDAGKPRQVIHPTLPMELPCLDLGAVPLSQRKAAAVKLARARALDPFDLEEGPLLRCLLLRLHDEEHLFSVTLHHIVGDGWSSGVLVGELMALYGAFAQGRPSPLPELPVQYADFAHWQRQWLKDEVFEGQLDYWRQQLGGAPQLLELPTDRPRPATPAYGADKRVHYLSPQLTAALNSLCRREGTTLFMVLLALFDVLLWRHGGRRDLLVGTPIANRNRAELEPLIGFFANSLVLRSRLQPGHTFRELLDQVRQTTLAAYEHQDLPFEKIVEALRPERALTHNPLVQVMFALQNAPLPQLTHAGLELKVEPAESGLVIFDLLINLEETASGLRFSLRYPRALFDATTIDRLASHFQLLAERLSHDPDERLEKVDPWSRAERHQLLHEWNDVEFRHRDDTLSLAELFARRVKEGPQSPAVLYDDGTLTYRQLDQRSARLARHLQAAGIESGHQVALCLERSLPLAVAMMACVRLGAAYVPLDPTYPDERLTFMLEDTAAPVVLVTSTTRSRFETLVQDLKGSTAPQVLCLDEDEATIAGRSADALPFFGGPNHTIYIFYTSGSTGRPKGVVVPQRAVRRLVERTNYVDLGPSDRVAQAANASFDASTFEFWGAWLRGGTVVGLSKELSLQPMAFTARLREAGITSLFLTTALFNQVALEEPAGFRGLNTLMVGGEAAKPDRFRRVLEAGGPRRLLHVYGPTESTTFATYHPIEAVAADAASIPIGRPLANTTLFVLDESLRPVGAGILGELCLGGEGLAHGYHARPALTAQRFVPDAVSGTSGTRLYRTGDVVRLLPDGAVDFMGRHDHQIKLRGFRIELGEVEAALGRLDGVRQATVVAREDRPGDVRLVAYAVAEEGMPLDPQALRRELGESLPEYMVPAAFVLLDELPLNDNGKVDKKALPAPDATEAAPETAPEVREDPVEALLQGIWTDVLSLETVEPEDDFFELGGHSLLATQIVSRVRTAFDAEFPLERLFEEPTLGAMADHLRAQRRERQGTAPVPPLLRAPRDGALPVSFAQRRMWFIEQMQPAPGLYNVPAAVRLEGEVDEGLIERVLNEVVRRHEALRTTFHAPAGQPVQEISPHRALPLPRVDLRDLPEVVREAEARRLAGQDARRPFDLETGPVVRFTLLRLAPGDQVLLLAMHHIVSDGWSMGIFLKELAVLFEAFAADEPSPLPELAIQYADFSRWQRGWLTGEVLAGEMAYWKQKLTGAPEHIELPTDRPRPAVRRFRGGYLTLDFGPTLAQGLNHLAREEGVTLFMTLLAGLQTLLARTSGQWDVVVGSPIAGRNRKEIEGLIGFFVNTQVLRTELDGDPTFSELLARVRRTALDAYSHQNLPFEQLVEELAPQRDLGTTPLFQVIFALQNAPQARIEREGLTIRSLPERGGSAKFDLTLSMIERPEGLKGSLEYDRDLFDRTTVERLVVHFERLLTGMVARPDARLSDGPWLSPAEHHQVAVEWGDTHTAIPRESTLVELFHRQVQATPEARALVFGHETLTYGALADRANRLARHLVELGVGPEVLVGCAMARSLDTMISYLGILTAGGAFLPLEANYPEERLTFLLEDTDTPVVLVDKASFETFENLAQIVLSERWPAYEIVEMGTLEETLTPLPATPPSRSQDPESLAYMMYTSGSTGRPKGVAVSHRNVVRLVHNTNFLDFHPDHVFLQFAPVAFDASTLEIWGPLLSGGTLVMYPGNRASLEELGEMLAEQRVNTLWLTSGLFHRMVEDHLEGLRPVERLLAGGDVLSPQAIERVLQHLPGIRVINGYGPTENTTFTACHSMEDLADVGSPVPVGRAISNTRVHLLDRWLRPVPTGVVGELCAGGEGLARCYYKRPELTAQKMVPDPLAIEPGQRLYKTGDLARFLPDGTIEFLGRRDHQVKIRGFRIELGEIENALAQYPGVGQCVAHVWQRTNDKSLLAYVVADDPAPTADEMRAFLAESLPDYMMPNAFVFLPELPLNANGKVDRKALPAPEESASSTAYVAPRNPTEELLAGILAEVLERDRVGVEDNFFDLGGHSLLATQVVSRLRETFRIEFQLREFFEAPTVLQLAERVEASRLKQQGREAPPIVPVPRDGDLPLSFAQQRMWLIEQFDTEVAVYNIPGVMRLRGDLDIQVLRRVLAHLVARHESLRTVFRARDGQPEQVILHPFPLAVPLVELAGLSEAAQEREVLRWARADAIRIFDLAKGPLLRTCLLRLGEGHHVILITMHHIVSDGWSMGIFFRELTACYQALQQGQPAPFTPLPLQYADYAHWQRRWLSGEVLDAELAHWEERLEAIPTQLELPTDRPRPAFQTFRGRLLPIAFSPALSDELGQLSRRFRATLFMTLMAGFKALLSRTTHQRDLVVGTPIAGRQAKESEDLIGFFINTLVLRTDLSGDPTFAEILDRVRHVALEAYEHQELPFERLVEMVPDRNLNISPIFQVLFALQNAPGGALEIPGLIFEPLHTDARTAKLDLGFSMQEGNQRISGAIEFNTDLFDAATIRRLAVHFETLLESAVADPETRLSQLSWLSAPERHQMLMEWNDTRTDYPRDLTLGQAFEEQAARMPNAPALAFGDQKMTYRELDETANRLAHLLIDHGVGSESLVGLATSRGAGTQVAILAILKAGGAYLPLDPDYPAERLAFQLEDSEARWVLVDEGTREVIDGLRQKSPLHFETLDLSTVEGELAQHPTSSPGRRAYPQNLAYVIYTSGSTGRPKGVGVRHQGAVRLGTSGYFKQAPGGTTLQFFSVAFDVSCLEMWITWLSGGCLALFLGDRASTEDFAAALRHYKPTEVTTIPGVLHRLVEDDLEALALVRSLHFGGEVASQSHLRRILERFPGIRLVNDYGPTENSTTSTYYAFHSVREMGQSVPIGYPLVNSRAVVVDPALRAVPAGVVGELCVGGDGLARGYWRRPGLTAERFVPDPSSSEPGQRLYRTGDLIRTRGDGKLEFLGRRDTQVKLRGFRVELGEIEKALSRFPGVKQGVVHLWRQHDAARLVAYLLWDGAEEPQPRAIQDFLSESLPEHMVPRFYEVLDEIPLTPNSKVDYKALPAPGASGDDDYVAPRTPAEELLVEILADVLGLERVGVQDNFFNLGGHSLLANRAVSRIRKVFRREVPLRTLFELPTAEKLARRLEVSESNTAEASTPLVPVERTSEMPASFAQQRMVFLERYSPTSAAYNIPTARRLRGPLEIEALRRAFEEVTRRHEVLRTTYREESGEIFQVIAPPTPAILPLVDLTALPESRRETLARHLAQAEARRPFDLEAGPVLRNTLLRLGEDDHLLLLTLHHVAADGVSAELLVRELAQAVEAFSAGRTPDLQPLPVQYADFAAWQLQELSGPRLDAELTYWRHQLRDLPPRLELPTDRPRPTHQTFAGRRLRHALPESLGERLRELSRSHGVTPFMTTLAAFLALLGRLSGRADAVVGTPISGRSHADLEHLIGLFVNTLVLRVDLTGDPSFEKLLQRTRQVALEGYEHQHLPFERLVDEVGTRDVGAHPLFQVLFAFQQGEATEGASSGAPSSGLDTGVGSAKFDLLLNVSESPGNSVATLEWNTDLFDASTAHRWADHYVRLLEAAIETPDHPISSLPSMSPGEHHQLTVEWNDTAVAYPRTQTLAQIFVRQARATPEAPALVCGDRQWSYAELEIRSRRLAAELVVRGVGADSLVGVAMERSDRLILALLAVLRAGGAYLPLDPQNPVERLRFALEDTAATLVIVDEANHSMFKDLAGQIPLLNVSELSLDTDPPSPMLDATRSHPEALAYVMYTSGSTGVPKGVAVSQQAVLRLVRGSSFAHCAPGEVFLQFATVAFDVATFEIWGALLNGACLVVAPGHRVSLEELGDLIQHHGVTTLWLTAGLFQHMVEDHLDALRPVRQLLAGGDVLPTAQVRKVLEGLPNTRLINGYGPTENTTFTSCHGMAPGTVVPFSVSIGRAIANTRIHLLDPEMRPLPLGVPGELCTAGDGLARCYFRRPALTAAVLVPDPSSSIPGGRLYKTGDLARHLPDGTLEFLGRRDHQVKLRGFRIEPGEIERVLASHPAVGECMVHALGSGSSRRLVAYLVTPNGEWPEGLDAEILRAFLAAKLPDYMVPSDVLPLEALPLNASGKVDRKALPDPGQRTSVGAFVAPEGATEEKLAQLFGEVLEVERVGATDNFFRLGGHSMRALHLVTRIRRELGHELPLSVLFEHPSVKGLARHLEGNEVSITEGPVPLRTGGSQPPLFLVHPAGGNVFCYTELARSLDDRPVYGLASPDQGPDTLEALATHHLEAVRQVRPEGPYHLAGWSLGGLVAFEMARQLEAAGEAVQLVLIDTLAPEWAAGQLEDLSDRDLALQFARDLAATLGLAPQTLPAIETGSEDPEALLERMLEATDLEGLLPEGLGRSDILRLFRIFRRNTLAMAHYRPADSALAAPVTLLRATEHSGAELPDDLGWGQVLPRNPRVESITGNHYSILHSPALETLIQQLERGLA